MVDHPDCAVEEAHEMTARGRVLFSSLQWAPMRLGDEAKNSAMLSFTPTWSHPRSRS